MTPVILLLLYPVVAFIRYREYRYTRPEEAKQMFRFGLLGFLAFSLCYVLLNYDMAFVLKLAIILAILVAYIAGMSGFVRVNLRLNGMTPV